MRAVANPFARARIEHLTVILAGPEASTMRREVATAVADAQIDLSRVRATRISILERIAAVGMLDYPANPDWAKLLRFVIRSRGPERGVERFPTAVRPREPPPLPEDEFIDGTASGPAGASANASGRSPPNVPGQPPLREWRMTITLRSTIGNSVASLLVCPCDGLPLSRDSILKCALGLPLDCFLRTRMDMLGLGACGSMLCEC
jgi:hypothetical protein